MGCKKKELVTTFQTVIFSVIKITFYCEANMGHRDRDDSFLGVIVIAAVELFRGHRDIALT